MPDAVHPPTDGSLATVTDFVDFNAQHNGSHPFWVFPPGDSSQAAAHISFAQAAAASHRVAHRMRPGRAGPEHEVLGVLVHTDTAYYAVLMLGALRAGFVPYPMSPRNQPEAIAHMLKTTACTRVIVNEPTIPLLTQVQEELAAGGIALTVDQLTSFEDVFPSLAEGPASAESVPEYEPYLKPSTPLDIAATQLYLHSSGSTGFPKSIPFAYIRILEVFREPFFEALRPVRSAAMSLPPFHLSGLLWQVLFPLFSVQPAALFRPQHPRPPVVPHARNVYEAARATGCNGIHTVPSFVEEWSKDDEAVEYLKTLLMLKYAGGPLPQAVGDALVARGVPLCTMYGGTEFGGVVEPPRLGYADPHWNWCRFPLQSDLFTWVPQGGGVCELVIHETEKHHLSVHNVPGQKSYATHDLWEPHPTEQGLWRIVARIDDVITLSIGEKIVPLAQERAICASPLVAGAVMFGRERAQPGVLVEPASPRVVDPRDAVALAAFRSEIWPVVEAANAQAPAYAKIFKEMILVTKPGETLPRAGKGAVVRAQALGIYSREIDELYQTVESSAGSASPPESWDETGLRPWLMEQALGVGDVQTIDSGVSLFEQGFDSLRETFLRNRIIGVMRASSDPAIRAVATRVPSSLLFDHASVNELATAIALLVNDPSTPPASTRVPIADIEAMVTKYTASLPVCPAQPAMDGPVTVLLTGVTGSVGAHVLAVLLAAPGVARVYALVRPSATADASARLATAFRTHILPTDLLASPKLFVLPGDATAPRLGLADAAHAELWGAVTHIVHHAWKVNFNAPLAAFEPHVAGLRTLVDACAASGRRVRLLVTSSVGVAARWSAVRGVVPEAPLEDVSVAAGSGYAASKIIVEKIMEKAAAHGVAGTTVRMGQACGSATTGAWNTSEWFPSLVKSSIALGCFPDLQQPVSWVPLYAIGQIYAEWVTVVGELPPFVNLVHPQPTPWKSVLQNVMLALGRELPVVSLDEWLRKVEAIANHAGPEDVANVPAIRLVDSFRQRLGSSANTPEYSAATFSVARLMETSSIARSLKPLSPEHATAWVRYWRQIGFISQE